MEYCLRLIEDGHDAEIPPGIDRTHALTLRTQLAFLFKELAAKIQPSFFQVGLHNISGKKLTSRKSLNNLKAKSL